MQLVGKALVSLLHMISVTESLSEILRWISRPILTPTEGREKKMPDLLPTCEKWRSWNAIISFEWHNAVCSNNMTIATMGIILISNLCFFFFFFPLSLCFMSICNPMGLWQPTSPWFRAVDDECDVFSGTAWSWGLLFSLWTEPKGILKREREATVEIELRIMK